MEKNRFGIENQENYEDIVNHFMPFSVDELHNKKAEKLISDLREENKRLKLELKRSEAKLEQKCKNPFNKQYDYKVLEDKLTSEYSDLRDVSLKNLITAEYLFLNEKLSIDYTGVFIAYIKVIELELREKLNISEMISLGGILKRIKIIPEFKGFVKAMESSDFIKIRNRGVHMNSISKHDCGKIRNMLIKEGWLNRLISLLEMQDEKLPSQSKVVINDFIIEEDLREKVGNKFFNSYITEKGRILLSERNLKIGSLRVMGTEKEINGIEYFIV